MKKIILLSTILVSSSTVWAAGYQLQEYSVTGLGRAMAGAGIMGDDYSALAFNPAGMGFNERSGAQLGFIGVDLRSKVKGSKQAISLVKNADKVSSVLNDVIGDVCGILSGAAGASIVVKIAIDNSGSFMSILIPSLIAAIIAGLTIAGKAIFKSIAIKHSNTITLQFAKFINFFTRRG